MRTSKQLVYAVIIVFFLTGLLVSCGGSSNGNPSDSSPVSNKTSKVKGNITDVQPSSFFGLESLTIVDDEGSQWQFEGRDVAVPGFAASHLREHMIFGMPVLVTYENYAGVLVIKDIEDATEPALP